MAYRLGEYVIYGEIRNTRHYSTSGFIVLRGEGGRETILRLSLTGDCCADLRGKRFRFRASQRGDRSAAHFSLREHRGFQLYQIGPTGTITASTWVRAVGCSPVEFLRRCALDEPPPTDRQRRFYLEWYGQNGRVVIELCDPLIEECVRDPVGTDDEGEWAPLPSAAPPPSDGSQSTAGPGFAILRLEGGDLHAEHYTARSDPADRGDSDSDLIPRSLQEAFDAQAEAVDRAIRGETDGSGDALADVVLLDHCIESGDGTPVSHFLGDLAQMPRAESLDDEAVESQLKALLARLALIHITLDVCSHASPSDCYRLLRDEILPDCTAYEELIGTSWVTHVSTYDHCRLCEAELDDPSFHAGYGHGD
ncbi:MAG: hypothetical protein ACYTAN_12825 [Planctomycetota bacterium]|jgi:hypothetical protein